MSLTGSTRVFPRAVGGVRNIGVVAHVIKITMGDVFVKHLFVMKDRLPLRRGGIFLSRDLQTIQVQLPNNHFQFFRRELGEMRTESKLKGMSVSTPKSRPYRRTRSPIRPRAEDEEEDILDIKTIQLAPPQYTIVSYCRGIRK
jgi:hypothetical protein